MGFWDKVLPASQAAQDMGALAPIDIEQSRRMALVRGAMASLAAPRGSNFLQALGGGVGEGLDTYQNALGSAMKLRMAQTQQAQAQAAEQRRRAIFAKYPPQPGESRDQSIARFRAMLNEAIQIGDTDTVSRLSEYLKSADNGANGAQAQRPSLQKVIGPDGKPSFAYVSPEGVQPVEGARPFEGTGTPPSSRMFSGVNPATGQVEMGMIDPRTKQITWTGVKPGSKREGAPTEAELKAGFLYRQAQPAVDELAKMMQVPGRFEALASKGNVNEALTVQRQRLLQAGRVVARAKLRLESGAAVPDAEADAEMRTMLPQPGDAPILVQRKKEYLASVMSAMRQYAARALTPEENAAPDWQPPSPEMGAPAGEEEEL
jgi:hypothetical protein